VSGTTIKQPPDSLLAFCAKRCPFCDASPHDLCFSPGLANGSECVECKKCGARGPWSQGTGEDGSQRKAALKLWGEAAKPRYWEKTP
jgi:hypothetical protein